MRSPRSYDQALVNSLHFEDLTAAEWGTVDGWVDYMNAKYQCVGLLKAGSVSTCLDEMALQEYQDFAQKKSK